MLSRKLFNYLLARSMKISAIFESWLMGDGSYPPLKVGQPVNLSFEMRVDDIEPAPASDEPHLRQVGNANKPPCSSHEK